MSPIFGVALELGDTPNLRGLTFPASLSRTRSFLVTSTVRSSTNWMFRACRSIEGKIVRQEKLPEWLVIDTYDPSSPLSELAPTWKRDHVYFYSPKALDSSTPGETAVLEHELQAAMALLLQLSPAEDAATQAQSTQAPPGLRLARQRRDELLAKEKWLTASDVHIQQGGDPHAKGSGNAASRLRKRGELLGVWTGREYLHPAFQFRRDTGMLMTEVAALLRVLPKDEGGWRPTFWLFQKHRQLQERRPVDVFQEDPDAVLDAAKSDFTIRDEQW